MKLLDVCVLCSEQSFLEQTKEEGHKIRLVQDQEALMDSQGLLRHFEFIHLFPSEPNHEAC